MNWLEMVGFAASALVAVSLMMSNVFWLRVINLVGGVVFTIYGILIHSAPVAVMNAFVVVIDAYYLSQSFRKDYFKGMEVAADDYYTQKFLLFYQKEIRKFIPEFTGEISAQAHVFFILRNMVPAGLLITEERGDGNLWITLDFAIPAYRDFKLGQFIYGHQAEIFDANRYKYVFCEAKTRSHQRYLKRMEFVPGATDGIYKLNLYQPVHRIQ